MRSVIGAFEGLAAFCGQDNVDLVRQLGILIDIADLNLAAIGGHRLIEGGSEAAHVLMLALHELDILSRRVAASAHSGAEGRAQGAHEATAQKRVLREQHAVDTESMIMHSPPLTAMPPSSPNLILVFHLLFCEELFVFCHGNELGLVVLYYGLFQIIADVNRRLLPRRNPPDEFGVLSEFCNFRICQISRGLLECLLRSFRERVLWQRGVCHRRHHQKRLELLFIDRTGPAESGGRTSRLNRIYER